MKTKAKKKKSARIPPPLIGPLPSPKGITWDKCPTCGQSRPSGFGSAGRPAVTTGRAAFIVGSVSEATIYRAVLAGKIEAMRTPGGHYRVFVDSVRKFMEQGGGR